MTKTKTTLAFAIASILLMTSVTSMNIAHAEIDVTIDFESFTAGNTAEGLGALHPDLDVASPASYDTEVVEEGAAGFPGTAYNSNGGNNGCLTGDQGMGPSNFDGAYNNLAEASERVSLDFSFNGKTVNAFSIETYDYGDFNPFGGSPMTLVLTGYDKDNIQVDQDTFQINNANSDYDACDVDGIQTLQLSGSGIATIELRATSGPDPGVGFDNINFTLETIDVEKSWTHTDYNWDQVCDGEVNPADGLCYEDDSFAVEIPFRDANINYNGQEDPQDPPNLLPDDDVLANPLDQDGADKYIAYAQTNKEKFSNTNPGAFYALTTIDVINEVEGLKVTEDYSACVDELLKFVSKKETRNVKVAIADPDGFVTEITDDLYDIDAITADNDEAVVTIDAQIDAGSTVFVLVKFQDNLKGDPALNDLFDAECLNTESVDVLDDQGQIIDTESADATLRITNDLS